MRALSGPGTGPRAATAGSPSHEGPAHCATTPSLNVLTPSSPAVTCQRHTSPCAIGNVPPTNAMVRSYNHAYLLGSGQPDDVGPAHAGAAVQHLVQDHVLHPDVVLRRRRRAALGSLLRCSCGWRHTHHPTVFPDTTLPKHIINAAFNRHANSRARPATFWMARAHLWAGIWAGLISAGAGLW